MNKEKLMLGNVLLADYMDEKEQQQTSIAFVSGISEHSNLGDGFSIEIDTGIEEASYFNLRGIDLTRDILIKSGVSFSPDNERFSFAGIGFKIHNKSIYIEYMPNILIGKAIKYFHEFQNIILLLTDTKVQWID